jgi:hypothetical protein
MFWGHMDTPGVKLRRVQARLCVTGLYDGVRAPALFGHLDGLKASRGAAAKSAG